MTSGREGEGVECHGEYQLKTSVEHTPVTFTGRDQIEVKRRALDHWYRVHRPEGRTLKEFLDRCRLSLDGQVIVFTPWS